jgi:hypothetical protein
MPQKFAIKLKQAHDETGLSAYGVHKKTGIATNTVYRYTESDVVLVDKLELVVIRLAEFYGLDWRDPDVIKVIDNTPLAISA